jgi:hypothetical protein
MASRGERNARFDDRHPHIDPWFRTAWTEPGYSQPDAIDPTGYTVRDPELDGRLVDGELGDDSAVPAGSRVGRPVAASYGDDTVHPTPGGFLGEAGACSTPAAARLPAGEFLGPQHAIPGAPLEYGGGLTAPHALPEAAVSRDIYGSSERSFDR